MEIKTIWLFQIGEPLPIDPCNRKMRTALLAEKLAEAGHKVVWWASAFDHQKKIWIEPGYKMIKWKPAIDIVLLKGCGYSKNLSLKRFVDHRLVAKQFRSKSKLFPHPDLIVASLPSYDLAYEAVVYAKRNGIPSVVDIRDMWPDVFLDHLPKSIHPIVRLLLKTEITMVKKCLKNADALTSMMEEVLQWGLDKAQRSATNRDKVFYLGGEPLDTTSKNEDGKIKDLLPEIKGKFVVCFIGTFGYYNNPSILVDAAGKIQDENIIFVIGGDGVFLNEVEHKAKGMKNVFLPGWLDQNEIQGLLKVSSVGVIPATVESNAFPNKAFVYFSAGIPIISSCSGDLKNILEQYNAGFNFQPNSTTELVELILTLATTKSLYETQCQNSITLFNNRLDANKIYQQYVEYIDYIL